MKKKIPVILILFCIFTYKETISAESGWRFEYSRDGITVHTRESEISSFRECMAECIIDAPVEECHRVLMDIPNIYKWQPDCIESRPLLIENNNTRVTAYNLTQVPWPASNRDVVTLSIVNRTQDSITQTISAIDKPDLVPLRNNTVRIKRMDASWILTRKGDTTVVTFRVRVDPGGWAPAWIVNKFSTENPYKTLIGLKKNVRRK